MDKEQSFHRTAKRSLDEWVHILLVIAKRWGVRKEFLRLLGQVHRRTTWLRPRHRARDIKAHDADDVLFALLYLAQHHRDWIRQPETWGPAGGGLMPQFTSLAHHLFALYPVPRFMTSAWFAHDSLAKAAYKHLGRGQNIRTVDLPLPLTRAMAHWFTQAPDHLTFSSALRWAQVRGLGGTEALARAVLKTRLGRRFEHEDFWVTVLHFFVNHPRIDLEHLGPIVDFIHQVKFTPREAFVPGAGIVPEPPAMPNFSMKGRTVKSLLRLVEEWRRELRHGARHTPIAWERSGISAFRLVEEDGTRCWTLRELLTSRELFLEGQAMRHCVGSYVGLCSRGTASIWTLQVDTGHGPRRALTVDVDLPTRTLFAVRGRCNRDPRDVERDVLRRWAEREGLSWDP